MANFTEKQAQLKHTIKEHNETLKEAVDCLLDLVNLELSWDKEEQERIFHDVVDESGVIRHSTMEQTTSQKVEVSL